MIDSYIRPIYCIQKKKKCYIYKKADWNSLNKHCEQLSSSLVLRSEMDYSVHDLWDLFKSTLNLGINSFIPSKFVKKRSSLPWMNKHLTKLIKKKCKLYKQAKTSGIWNEYKEHQNLCRKEIRKAEYDFINRTITDGLAENNPKPFWKYIKSKKCDNIGVAPLKVNGKLESHPQKKAEVLLDQFRSVFTKNDSDNLPPVKLRIKDSLSQIKIETKGVEKLLSNIKPSKASGPDNIPNLVLKNCARALAPGVAVLFQKSLDTGELPKDWTDANVSPVFKKGDKHLAENYRPVSLTSVLSKNLEHIVCHEMHKHFDRNKVLTNVNHGFRSGFSCETQLTITFNDFVRSADNNTQTDIAILDFSKAFDTVPHRKLLHKLESYGIRGSLHSWISSFLCKRQMRVVLDGESSKETEVISGVPQGTVLGPLLFLVHINDLPDSVSSNVRLFADDCLLYREIKSRNDQEILQKDLQSLEIWAETWGMRFNAKKCYILSVSNKGIQKFYQLDSCILKEVDNNPYLGLMFSNDLKWTTHINKISNKASSTLGFIQRNLKKCPQECKKTAYIALVRSTLEYGSSVWDPYLEKDIYQLEKIQRKAVRFIKNDYKTTTPGSVTNMLIELELPTLKERRKNKRLCFLYNIAKGSVPAIPASDYLLPIRNKRRIKAKTYDSCITQNIIKRHQNLHSNCFQLPESKTIPYKNSFFPKTISDWNELSEVVVSAPSIDVFKARLSEQ